MTKSRPALDPHANELQIAAHINSAFASNDIEVVHQAIGEAAKLFNMKDLAAKADVQRETLYRSFGGRKSANLTTAINVLSAMGLQLRVVPVGKNQSIRRTRVDRKPPVENL